MKMLTRAFIITSLGLALATLGYVATAQDRPATNVPGMKAESPAIATDGETDAASDKAAAALDKPADEFIMDKQPLDTVLDRIWEKTGVSARVDWPALTAAGLDRKAPASVNLKKIPWSKVLNLVLTDVGGATNPLDWCIDGGVVVVSTKDALNGEAYRTTRDYDLSFLLWDQDDRISPGADTTKYLLDLIKATVAPTTWIDNGGTIGSIRTIGRTMVVTTTAKHQHEIAALLARLQAADGFSVRAYDIRDLLGTGDAKVLTVSPATRPGDRLGRAEMIMQVIRTTVARDSWRDPLPTSPPPADTAPAAPNGMTPNQSFVPVSQTKTSSIIELDGKLYITTTAATHRQIDTLLKLMREKPAQP